MAKMITYNDMTEREELLHRILSRIAEASEVRPGYLNYLSKKRIGELAAYALREFEKDLRAERGAEVLDAIAAGEY